MSLIILIFFLVVVFYGMVIIDSFFVFVIVFDIFFVVFSIVVVIWCFWDYLNEKVMGLRRERYGLVVFGIVFIFNGFVIIIVFSFNLEDEKRFRYVNLLWFVFFGFSIIYCFLVILEFWIFKRY